MRIANTKILVCTLIIETAWLCLTTTRDASIYWSGRRHGVTRTILVHDVTVEFSPGIYEVEQ